MSAAVSSSLPIFSANNPLAVAPAPAPSPEVPHANAFSQMLKQRQQAQAAPAAAPPAASRAPTTQPAKPVAPAAPKAAQAPASAATERPQGGQKAESPTSAESAAKGDAEATASTASTDATDAATSDNAASPTGLDPSLGSWLAGLNLPAASTQAGGKLARGQAEAGDAASGDAPGGKAGGEGGGRGARRLGGEAPGARADRAAPSQGAEAPAAKLLAEAADHGASFREVAAQVHGAGDSARTDAAPASGALLAAGLAATAPSAPAEAPTVVSLPTPVDAPDFTQALGVQVSVLAADGVQQAELHLNPAEMGPISVQIVIDGSQAQVDFGADMASTRQLIESGLPELASALRDAGFTLTGGGVSQQARQGSSEGGQGRGEGGSRPRSSVGGVEAAQASTPRRSTARVSAGGLDLYA
ncbi:MULTISPECIES: flagellar hook-length control protein FliK [unclassified Rhizobacter]|uniref:flagellar hook-length control protein FliK n=1 Tax=unclassified Rhizobacter TaxID=2640088 RepID=UPI0006FAB572|nr:MULTISPECIES: flagellar hook-length control protein FliK [unclassified Rhizobacter]KQU71346.1 hypothetical protein ASC88_06200 [Rhizobacter sp. Root29]KQW10608.1 hypothetical protein ASC98_22435 [Rhizobacter sp. Root1238]KRB24684.1 hypothetical protein ASE08_00315 [Rhizobacter sp. Root16D2]